MLNKEEGGVGQCSKALIGSTRGAPSTPQLRQERRSGTFPRTVIPQCLILFCISVDRCSRSYRSASCTSSSLGCVVQEVLGNLFLSSEEVYRICMFVASLCYSALVYSTSSQFTSSVSVVAPLNGSEGCGESRPEDSSTSTSCKKVPAWSVENNKRSSQRRHVVRELNVLVAEASLKTIPLKCLHAPPRDRATIQIADASCPRLHEFRSVQPRWW